MNTQDQYTNSNYEPPRQNNRVWGGLFLLIIGGIFFLREADFFFFPSWLFSWPMILIAVGVYTGIRHQFRGAGWLIPIVVGAIFMPDQFHIGFDLHRFIVPFVIIGVGAMMIFRPRHRRYDDKWTG